MLNEKDMLHLLFMLLYVFDKKNFLYEIFKGLDARRQDIFYITFPYTFFTFFYNYSKKKLESMH